MTNTSRWVIGIIVAVILLSGIQWYLNSRSNDTFNNYGNLNYGNEATSTDTADSLPSAIQGMVSPNASQAEKNAAVGANEEQSGEKIITKNFMHTITIETNKGTIVFETYDADAPNTVKNFITLAEKGFYSNIIFHRIIKGFMIQGGDPTGTGGGGPGYQFADELNPNTPSSKAGYVRGTVAMANSGPNTNGSQFFIMHKDNPLPHLYTIFGKVISGMDVVDAIANVATASGDRPIEDVVMKKVTVSTK